LNKSSSLPGLHKNLKTIFTAARRSADITSQLLNFTKKRSTNAEILNLNDEIKTILEMLQLLMGENIKLEWNFSFKSWPVKIDRSQLHQIVTNLCINARDALFGTGKIIIELFNITINEKMTLKKSELPPGDFVRLEIYDNGCGMDKSTISNIFEPFFTTKQKGKGVGLGLSSVWNIVQQNNGFIDVASEKEKGTCFIIYFPRQKDQQENIKTEDILRFEGNNETILLVEDNEMVKEMCLESLNFLNYKVLGTSTPAKAIMLASKSPVNITLLITDIIMPQINGAELAKLLKEKYPDLKVLFMSGHTPDILDHYNINLNSDNFLQKPFTQRNLAQKVSKVLRHL
jgi:two-component system, cell cycle sensor histidine kinase and response regulator CckA